MTYRFQRFASSYPSAAASFERDVPDHNQRSYEELFALYTAKAFAQGDAFSANLKNLGIDARDVFVTIAPLQAAWAREHGVHFEPDRWLETVAAQIEEFSPDVVYLEDLYLFDSTARRRLREALGPAGLLVGWRAAPTHDYSELSGLDAVFSAGQNFVEKIRETGVPSFLLPLAFDPRVLELVPATERDIDVSFIGSVGHPRDVSFAERRRFIESMMDLVALEVWDATPYVPASPADRSAYVASKLLAWAGVSDERRRRIPLVRRGWAWRSSPAAPPLAHVFPERTHAAAFGLDYLTLLRRSKITLNFHTSAAERFGGNLRMYEATGMGACLVTDWKDNLPDLFAPGTEVESFRSTEECVEKVRSLLADEVRMRSIASSGQSRTLRDHTWAQRMEQLDGYLQELMAVSR